MWDLPGQGLEPVSPALAGRFLTTEPPGKSQRIFQWIEVIISQFSENSFLFKYILGIHGITSMVYPSNYDVLHI